MLNMGLCSVKPLLVNKEITTKPQNNWQIPLTADVFSPQIMHVVKTNRAQEAKA